MLLTRTVYVYGIAPLDKDASPILRFCVKSVQENWSPQNLYGKGIAFWGKKFYGYRKTANYEWALFHQIKIEVLFDVFNEILLAWEMNFRMSQIVL